MDESEAAVKAIVQNRRGWNKNKMLFRLILDKDRLYTLLSNSLLKKEAQPAFRITLKAVSKKESVRATVKISWSPFRKEGKPVLVFL